MITITNGKSHVTKYDEILKALQRLRIMNKYIVEQEPNSLNICGVIF